VRATTLADSKILTKHGVTVVGVKSPGSAFREARPETVIGDHDVIIVSGTESQLERFSALDA
jgi:trk system potassium uptake protein TrkA